MAVWIVPLAATGLEADRANRLQEVVIQDCGSCHGLRLTGGLGPPITPQALAGWQLSQVVDVISNGRPNTAMPPFEPVMTAAEIRWIAEGLLNGRFVKEHP